MPDLPLLVLHQFSPHPSQKQYSTFRIVNISTKPNCLWRKTVKTLSKYVEQTPRGPGTWRGLPAPPCPLRDCAPFTLPLAPSIVHECSRFLGCWERPHKGLCECAARTAGMYSRVLGQGEKMKPGALSGPAVRATLSPRFQPGFKCLQEVKENRSTPLQGFNHVP